MSALEALLSRRSCAKLIYPAPSDEELETMFSVAMTAPDHAGLRPWRFIIIRGASRTQLGKVFASAAANNSTLSEGQKNKWLNAPLRAPLLVAVVARIQSHVKVPAQEQRYAAAAATTNFLHAVHTLGYGAIWRTGNVTYLPEVADSLGLSSDATICEELLGFVYIGTPAELPKPRASYILSNYVSEYSANANLSS